MRTNLQFTLRKRKQNSPLYGWPLCMALHRYYRLDSAARAFYVNAASDYRR